MLGRALFRVISFLSNTIAFPSFVSTEKCASELYVRGSWVLYLEHNYIVVSLIIISYYYFIFTNRHITGTILFTWTYGHCKNMPVFMRIITFLTCDGIRNIRSSSIVRIFLLNRVRISDGPRFTPIRSHWKNHCKYQYNVGMACNVFVLPDLRPCSHRGPFHTYV